jgi:CubicO group peptidase (beta-lactamase class C family)
MKKVISIVIVVVFLSSACLYAQTNTPKSEKDFGSNFDTYIRKTMDRLPDVPGLAVVVIRGDRPVFIRGYGLANRETGLKADQDTLFYIASSTKSFTALAAALLDREGKIRLTDSIIKYSFGIQFKNALPDKITVRDLLTHTSGLQNEALTFRMAYSGDSDPADLKRVFADGTTYVDARYGKYNYDNLGYNIYAVLLQNQLKMKWQDVLQEKIFNPLGLKHTTAYVSKAEAKKWKVATGYMFDPIAGKVVRSPLAKTDANMQSAGGIFASITDIGRWLNMNMNGGKLDKKQIIPVDVIKAAHAGYTKTVRSAEPFTGEGQYGLGWQIGKYKGEKVVYHHGGFPGYASHISFLPDDKIAIAVLTNDGFLGQIAGNMIATYGYDWWLGAEDLDQVYERKLSDTVTRYGQWKKMVGSGAAERAKRPSQLTGLLADYAGTYENELFGTIEIAVRGNDLSITMGNINCIATPYIEKDTIRVEMMPGTGEVIKFQKNGEEKVLSLSYAGVRFAKAAR